MHESKLYLSWIYCCAFRGVISSFHSHSRSFKSRVSSLLLSDLFNTEVSFCPALTVVVSSYKAPPTYGETVIEFPTIKTNSENAAFFRRWYFYFGGIRGQGRLFSCLCWRAAEEKGFFTQVRGTEAHRAHTRLNGAARWMCPAVSKAII